MNYFELCPCCKHQKTAYTSKINAPMVQAFRKLMQQFYDTKEPVRKGDLDITHSQYTNMSTLKHFGIIEKVEGSRWLPTERGIKFYLGIESIPNIVAHMDDQRLPGDHPAWLTHGERPVMVTIDEVDEPAFKKQGEYQEEKSARMRTTNLLSNV